MPSWRVEMSLPCRDLKREEAVRTQPETETQELMERHPLLRRAYLRERVPE